MEIGRYYSQLRCECHTRIKGLNKSLFTECWGSQPSLPTWFPDADGQPCLKRPASEKDLKLMTWVLSNEGLSQPNCPAEKPRVNLHNPSWCWRWNRELQCTCQASTLPLSYTPNMLHLVLYP
jgi:hypothetical protein